MDVFAITCIKHLCYIQADPEHMPYCPKAYLDAADLGGVNCKSDWNIFQSDNHMMLLTEAVKNAVHEMNGVVNRLSNHVKGAPQN